MRLSPVDLYLAATLALCFAVAGSPVRAQDAGTVETVSAGNRIGVRLASGRLAAVRLVCARPSAAPRVEPAARLLRELALGHAVSMDRPPGAGEDSRELLLRRVFMPAPSGELLELGSEVAVARLGYDLDCVLPETLPVVYLPGAAAAVDAGPATAECVGRLAVVAGVVDGVTVVVGEGEKAEKVRLACVDAPETVNAQKSVEFFGKQASAFTTSLVLGRTLCLEPDSGQPDRDKNGRLVRYARLADGRDVSSEIIGRGYGYASTGAPCSRKKEYSEVERQARGHFQGLWNPNAQRIAQSGGRSIVAGSSSSHVDLGLDSSEATALGSGGIATGSTTVRVHVYLLVPGY